MQTSWLDDQGRFLGAGFPLTTTRPFTGTMAAEAGVSARVLRRLLREGLVRRVLQGVYAATQAPDDVLTRAAALALVLPGTAVVCDRTAAWLHGVAILPRSALTTPPPIDVVHVDDTRVRRSEVDGRRRGLSPDDLVVVEGIATTTPLRTALDLGRLLWRYDALAALDGFLRLGVPQEALRKEIGRFRGFRGVRQLRSLVPLADARSESVGESGLRLHWHDAGLPWPELQVWEYDDDGTAVFRLDLADPDSRFGAEYDGDEFHGEAQRDHDDARRTWLREERDWTVAVFTKDDVYARGGDPVARLRAGFVGARRTISLWSPGQRT